MTDAIADDSICMSAYGRIMLELYSLPSAQNSTIFKLLACLPSFCIDIQERAQFLQDLYDMVKQKMMNTNQNDGSSGINWNQVLMELTTIMHRVEEDIEETNENEQLLLALQCTDSDDECDGYEPAPMIQYDEEGFPIKYGPQDLEEQDPSTISSFTKKMWEIERKRRMKN